MNPLPQHPQTAETEQNQTINQPADSGELFAEIAVFSAIGKTLHYLTPPELHGKAKVGMRALIPLGRKESLGLIVSLHRNSTGIPPGLVIRPLTALADESPVVPADLIALCLWISEYYFYPLGEVLQAALPAGIGTIPRNFSKLAAKGREAGALDRLSGLPSIRSRGVRHVRLVKRPNSIELERSAKLAHFFQVLEDSGGSLPVRMMRGRVKGCDYWLRKLQGEGIVEISEIEEIKESVCAQCIPYTIPPSLTSEQSLVFETILPFIQRPAFQPFLLHGVAGSGKTEVYLRLVEEELRNGRSALILAPEIALSTQLEALFRHRFDSELAVWHSGLSPATRCDQWREVLSGNRRVLLGVRSAVFMPLSDLGLIIVDEEHDASYKQEDRLRYHARDVAIMRARMLGIPIVLSSATPSLQSLQHSRAGRYTLVAMANRVMDRPLPSLQAVDMRNERGRTRILSTLLRKELSETLDRGEQALLFLNRRGFSTFYVCPKCGYVAQCGHCSISLTYHQKDNRLRCHYCGCERPLPDTCPECGGSALTPHGYGTEKVEEEVREFFPDAKVARIDRDTVSRGGDMAKLLDSVRERRTDILIGTQMIAKGHDFPFITLVGVINADTALQVSDFRAGENTVQLLMQVAGRAGRGEKPGKVLLQTFNPSHYTIRSVLDMDYTEFCAEELASRERLQYPPFTRLLKFLVTAHEEEDAKEGAHGLASLCRGVSESLRADGRNIAVLGPAPAPIQKLLDRFRWHVFIKTWTNRDLQVFVEAVLGRLKTVASLRRAQVAVDRDPVSSY